MTHTQHDTRALGEASRWLARLRAEPDSEDAVTDWLRWCEEDPGNAEAFERVQRLWRQMDQVSGDYRALTAAEGKLATEVPALLPVRRSRWSKAVRPATWRIAAILVCAVGAVAVWQWGALRMAELPLGVSAPENRVASLPDGSVVHLGAKTSVDVDFRGSERRLRMSLGEAYFKVRPDKHRPFIVRAGAIEVTAVGTAFDVKAEGGRTSVTVQEGVVAVVPDKAGSGWVADTAWRVGPGYQFQYSERDGTAGLESVDTSAVLAWREGRLEYVNAPLTQVLADVNRYSRHPIDLPDSEVGQLTFTGTVFTDSIEGWLQGLPAALPVRIERVAGGVIRIRATTTPPR
jgi:transmembrane sensor